MQPRAEPGEHGDNDLGREDGFPRRALVAPDGGDVPNPGAEQHDIGGPAQTPERAGDPSGGVIAETPHRAEQTGDGELATYPDGSGEDMQGESDTVHGGREHYRPDCPQLTESH